ncbi:MAG: hypothetical protein LBE35_00785 [Clostridiales bacterium]|jgi:hypothetical protein|nr:hypothetical protein [Clostridiales bacterium]
MMWTPIAALVCVGIALAIAAVIMLAIRSKLKSVRREHSACNYERPGSFALTKQKDAFLYRNITRIPRAQPRRR